MPDGTANTDADNIELRTSQAAALAGVCHATIVRAARAGMLPHHWVGQQRRFRVADVIEWRNAQRKHN